jgi:hypothetical protein
MNMRNKMVLQIVKTRTHQLKSLKKDVNQLEFDEEIPCSHAG